MRFAQPKAFGAKVSDEFTVPLCRDHHRELHSSGNERAWWHDMGLDPLPVAKRLWDETKQSSPHLWGLGRGLPRRQVLWRPSDQVCDSWAGVSAVTGPTSQAGVNPRLPNVTLW